MKVTPWDKALDYFIRLGSESPRGLSWEASELGIEVAHERINSPGAPQVEDLDFSDPLVVVNIGPAFTSWFKKEVQARAEDGAFTYLNPDEIQNMLGLIEKPGILMAQFLKENVF